MRSVATVLFWTLALVTRAADVATTEAALGLHHLGPDGGLSLDIPLGVLALGGGATWSIALKHSVRLQANGTWRSEFNVPALASGLTFRRRNVIWRTLGGTEIEFMGGRDAPLTQTGAYVLLNEGDGNCSITSSAQVTYRYERYFLRSLVLPDGTVVECAGEGPQITRISASGHLLLDAKLNPVERNFAQIEIGPRRYEFHYGPGEPRELVELNTDARSGQALRFTYAQHLLAELRREGVPPLQFRWRPRADFASASHNYLLPVVLVADSQYEYGYAFRDLWLTLTARDGSGREETLVVDGARNSATYHGYKSERHFQLAQGNGWSNAH